MANPDLFTVRVRNRPNRRVATTTVDGETVRTTIPKRRKKVTRTTKKFSVTVSHPGEHDLKSLRCTYCHDEGELSDTVTCSGTHCKAVYHKECWDEPGRRRRAGCKIMGCGSTRSKALTPKKRAKRKKPTSSSGLNFVLTGKMSRTRNKIIDDIVAAGGKVKSSVSRKVDYLVTGAKARGTSKWSRATAENIPHITEEELYVLLGGCNKVMVLLDGYNDPDGEHGDEAGFDVSTPLHHTTATLVILDDDGDLIKFSRKTGLPTPATRELIGNWRLSGAAMVTYGITGIAYENGNFDIIR